MYKNTILRPNWGQGTKRTRIPTKKLYLVKLDIKSLQTNCNDIKYYTSFQWEEAIFVQNNIIISSPFVYNNSCTRKDSVYSQLSPCGHPVTTGTR